MSGHDWVMLSLISPGFFLLAIAYGIYAEARQLLMQVRLMWQRYMINRHLAEHGIAHDQVLPALMQLEAFSFEHASGIWTFRRGENGQYDFTLKQDAASPALENSHDG